MHKPANEAYVIPIGMDFITCDKQYMHKIIDNILKREGKSFEKPSAFFAKEFEAVPNITAINK